MSGAFYFQWRDTSTSSICSYDRQYFPNVKESDCSSQSRAVFRSFSHAHAIVTSPPSLLTYSPYAEVRIQNPYLHRDLRRNATHSRLFV